MAGTACESWNGRESGGGQWPDVIYTLEALRARVAALVDNAMMVIWVEYRIEGISLLT
jgi:hypothetical protein